MWCFHVLSISRPVDKGNKALQFKTTMNPDVSTKYWATGSLAPLTHLLAMHYSLRLLAPLHSFVCLLAHWLAPVSCCNCLDFIQFQPTVQWVTPVKTDISTRAWKINEPRLNGLHFSSRARLLFCLPSYSFFMLLLFPFVISSVFSFCCFSFSFFSLLLFFLLFFVTTSFYFLLPGLLLVFFFSFFVFLGYTICVKCLTNTYII